MRKRHYRPKNPASLTVTLTPVFPLGLPRNTPWLTRDRMAVEMRRLHLDMPLPSNFYPFDLCQNRHIHHRQINS
jgi:hypothetical protein